MFSISSLSHFMLLIGVDPVALDDVVGSDFFADVGIEYGSADLDTRRSPATFLSSSLEQLFLETRATGQNSSRRLLTGRRALGSFHRPRPALAAR